MSRNPFIFNNDEKHEQKSQIKNQIDNLAKAHKGICFFFVILKQKASIEK
jgi:hypothetical protein